MGIGGVQHNLNHGHPFGTVLEDLAHAAFPVVLLVDWDRTGGALMRRLEENMRARVQLDTQCRRRLAVACHTRCMEEIPTELSDLRGKIP